VAGGKALNVARVAKSLGADAHAVVALGGHVGAYIAQLLAADGVPASVVPLAAVTRTCAAIVELGGGASSTDVYEPATPLTTAEWRSFADATRMVVAGRRPWVAVSGSLPEGVSAHDVASLVGYLRAAGARVAVDSSGHGLRALAPLADLVKVNRAEAEGLLGAQQPDAAAAARAMHDGLGCDVVVTDGIRRGCAILREVEVTIPAPATTGRFSAGSGDAFLGGLLTAFDRGDSPEGAVALATSAAERNAQVPGQGVIG
jgi:fructose-1-phosphate kinase PfkB-like protein